MRFWSRSDFKEWPPGVSDGLVSCCQRCGQRPDFDFQITDEAWRAMVPAQMSAGVICLPCLDVMAKGAGLDVCEHLREVQFAGGRSTAILVPALVVRRQQ